MQAWSESASTGGAGRVRGSWIHWVWPPSSLHVAAIPLGASVSAVILFSIDATVAKTVTTSGEVCRAFTLWSYILHPMIYQCCAFCALSLLAPWRRELSRIRWIGGALVVSGLAIALSVRDFWKVSGGETREERYDLRVQTDSFAQVRGFVCGVLMMLILGGGSAGRKRIFGFLVGCGAFIIAHSSVLIFIMCLAFKQYKRCWSGGWGSFCQIF